jgi:anion-transporting  ArsA/GET3 family ATPase
MSVVTGTISKVLGGQMLRDVQNFVAAFDTLFGGFRARAEQTYQILKDRQTAFLVVASPEVDALREAAFFVERLAAESMPLAGLVLNRLTPAPPTGISTQAALAGAERLADDDALTAGLLELHAERLGQVNRERALRRRFAAAHPSVATATVAALATDVHDLDSLRLIASSMTA